MTQLEKYQFQPLDSEAIAALVQTRVEPAPSWDEAQVEQIRATAHAAGLREGEAAALEKIENMRVAALAAIEKQLSVVGGQMAGLGVGLEKAASSLAYAIARIVAQDALQTNALAVIEAILARCLGDISGAPRLVIEVHDSLVDAVTGRLEEMVEAAGFAGRARVTGGAAHPADCRLEWPEGGLERQMSRILDDLDNQFRAHGVAIENTPKTGADEA
ncbi:MAG: hypothetical protein ACC634_03750 [Hyphomicrobiales bacterium]